MSNIGDLVERLVAKGIAVGEASEIIALAVAAGASTAPYRKPKPEKAKTLFEEDCAVRGKYSLEFENFWKEYPRSPTMSKTETWKQWLKLSADDRGMAMKAVEPYRKYLLSQPTLPAVHACRFLSQQRFSGFFGPQARPAHTGMDGRI